MLLPGHECQNKSECTGIHLTDLSYSNKCSRFFLTVIHPSRCRTSRLYFRKWEGAKWNIKHTEPSWRFNNIMDHAARGCCLRHQPRDSYGTYNHFPPRRLVCNAIHTYKLTQILALFTFDLDLSNIHCVVLMVQRRISTQVFPTSYDNSNSPCIGTPFLRLKVTSSVLIQKEADFH